MAKRTQTRRRTTAEVMEEQTVPGDQLKKRIANAAKLQKRVDKLAAEIAEMQISADLTNAYTDLNDELGEIQEALEKGLIPEHGREVAAAGYLAKVGQQAHVATIYRKGALMNYLRRKTDAEGFLELVGIGIGVIRDYVPKKDLHRFLKEERTGRRTFSFKEAK